MGDETPPGRDGDGPEDIDAEFAAMMEGLDLPAEMQADLAALEEASGPQGLEGGEATHGAGRNETGGSVVPVSAEDVPHNTYRAPGQGGGAEAGPALTAEQEAEVAALAAALDAAPVGHAPGAGSADGAEGTQDPDGEGAVSAAPRAVKIAVVLTPLASAEALASLCAMSDLDCVVVPARSGAVAVKELVSAHAEWDVSELLGGEDSEPAEAAELAAALSRLSRGGAVLLTADLATDVGIEAGLSGTITARHYASGRAGEEASAGLLLAQTDQVVEDLLLGLVSVSEAPGAIRTSEVRPGRAARFLGRGLRRPKGGSQD